MSDPIISAEEVDDFIILRAGAFTNKIQRMIRHDVLKDEGLSHLEWRMLFGVARLGACHQKRITDDTSLDPAHASRAVAALERMGFLEGRRDGGDNRRRILSLTEAGTAKVERVWPKTRGVIRAITNELNSEEFERLKQLLDRVNEIAAPMFDGTKDSPISNKKNRRTAA